MDRPPAPAYKGIMPGLLLWSEFLALFGLLPLLFALGWLPVPKIPLLLAVAAACLAYLARTGNLDRPYIAGLLRDNRNAVRFMALRCLAVTILSVAAVLATDPGLLFGFPRTRPILWLMVMLLYPILSAFPQEAIYRAFLFRRYTPILKSPEALTVASVLAFSFLHIVFANWIAVLLTLPAGYVFTRTYRRTGSLTLATMEHAAYGCIVFTTGLGRFFYHPS